MWILILRECSHSCRYFCSIVTHYICQDYSVSNTVWQVMECTKFVSHRVVQSKECICECHTSHA